KIIKIILLYLVTFGYLNAGVILDIDQKTCENGCETYDLECNQIQLKVCETTLSIAAGATESEVIKFFLKYTSTILIETGVKMVELGLYESKSVAYEKLMLAFGTRFQVVGQAYFYNGGFNPIDKIGLIDFAADIVYDIVAGEIIDGLDESKINALRSIPGLSNGRSDDIRQGLKWVFKVFFNDLKATIYSLMGNVTAAWGAAVVDNTLVLAEISVAVTGAAFEYFDSATALAMSKKRGEILDLYWKDSGPYLRAKDIGLKQRALDSFLIECKKIQLDLGESITANWAKPLIGYAPQLNQELKNRCDDYYFEMQKNNVTKKYMLASALNGYSEERYNKLIEYYFHVDDWNSYKELYKITNYDFTLRVSNNSVMREYLRKFMSYGFTIDDISEVLSESAFITPDYHMKEYMTNNLVFSAYIGLQNDNEYVPVSWQDKNANNIQNMTRIEFASFLVNTFQLIKRKPYFTPIEYASFTVNPLPDTNILKSLGIVKSDDRIDFRPDDILTSFEALVMTVNTMDYKKCGYVGCEISEILGVQQ
ncbi:MAG: hypothetical protein KAI79_13610, partial [Bacteroidales bacterium]|nr:hypothetical protein [Bacteroidales bacterium]